MNEPLLRDHKTYDSTSVRVSLNDNDKNLMTLTWEEVNVYTKAPTESCFSRFKKKIEGRSHLIQNVYGLAKPGELMAIMGASGAGKTTLMNMLTFRNQNQLIRTGHVKINGTIVEDSSQLATISAYVQQDDIFIGTLKVKEHLKFQAMLRMPGSVSYEDKMDRVEQVLLDLNLKKCENTLIGSSQLNIKGISGGERRRLAFASEIITNPSILFCDEPTSGLDSFMAMSIVESMKALASQGKTIICTIHQPSSEIFEMFDRLYLMAEGRLAYTGTLQDAFKFFASQGYPCPANYNPADHYIKNLAIVPTNREQCLLKVKSICDGFDKSDYLVQLKNDIASTSRMVNSISSGLLSKSSLSGNYKTNSFVQLRWLIWRSSLSTARNPLETKVNVIQTIFIAVMFGLIYLQQKLDQAGVQNINGVLFLFITNNSFSNIFPIINSFPAEIPIFMREHQAGMYRVVNYYFSKVFSELPKYFVIPFLFVAISYWMCNLNNDVGRFLFCCAVIIIVANNAISFASLISAAAPNINVALAVSGPLLVPLMIFSGYFLNNDTIPDYFIWLKYISWLSYANNILVVNQWKGIEHIDCPANTTRCFRTGDDVIKSLNIDQDKYLMNFAYLGILYVGYRLLAFLVLLKKSYSQK